MLVHGRQRQGQEQKLNMHIQGRSLEKVNNEKFLGVQIDQSLSWHEKSKNKKEP